MWHATTQEWAYGLWFIQIGVRGEGIREQGTGEQQLWGNTGRNTEKWQLNVAAGAHKYLHYYLGLHSTIYHWHQ